MIIIIHYTLEPGKDGGACTIHSMDTPYCPECGVMLSGYDTRLRHIIDGVGAVYWFRLRRLRCSGCGKLHLELPDFMQPYKHYEAQHIREVLSSKVDFCPADDSTIRRWKKGNHPPGLPVQNDEDVLLSSHTDMKGE